MLYSINLKNIKKSANALKAFLKQHDINLAHHQSLQAIAKMLFIKNYNTLESLAKRPRVIEYYEEEKKYMFEITINCDKSTLLELLKSSFTKANAQYQIENMTQQGEDFYFEVDLLKSDTNILVAMMLFAQALGSAKFNVKRFDYCRISCEKASLMQAVLSRADSDFSQGVKEALREKPSIILIGKDSNHETEASDPLAQRISKVKKDISLVNESFITKTLEQKK